MTDIITKPCRICGVHIPHKLSPSLGCYPVVHHDCRPVPGGRLDAANAEIADLKRKLGLYGHSKCTVPADVLGAIRAELENVSVAGAEASIPAALENIRHAMLIWLAEYAGRVQELNDALVEVDDALGCLKQLHGNSRPKAIAAIIKARLESDDRAGELQSEIKQGEEEAVRYLGNVTARGLIVADMIRLVAERHSDKEESDQKKITELELQVKATQELLLSKKELYEDLKKRYEHELASRSKRYDVLKAVQKAAKEIDFSIDEVT